MGQLIAGIANVLIGMKRGEERIVCIHPHYSYGMIMVDEPEILFVRLELMDFEEGETNVKIQPICPLENRVSRLNQSNDEFEPLPFYNLDSLQFADLCKTYKKLQIQNEKIHHRKFYNFGIVFWDSIMRAGIKIDIDEFAKRVNTNKGDTCFKDVKQKNQFILDFKSFLFNEQYQKGIRQPFTQYWLS